MTERSRALRSRSNFVASDAVEIPDQHAAVATPTKRNRNISNNSGFDKSDDQTSFRKRLTRASSEAKSSSSIRPTRRTRSNSMECEALIQDNVIKINNSGITYTSANTRKRRSPLPSKTSITEETDNTLTSIVALDHVLPNLNDINEKSSEISTTEESNKSMFISKETFKSSHENTCKDGIEDDVNAKKEHTTLAENPSAKTLHENETDMSINKDTLSDISEKSRSDAADTTTQMRTSMLDVPKNQSRISTEVTARKLRLKNESSTNNSIKEDEHLSNKENRAYNIIEDLQNKDVSLFNTLSQSPLIQPVILSEASTGTSIKEYDEEADSTDNMQNLIVTDTDSLNDSIYRDSSGTEICKDSHLDERIQILECSQNVKNKNSLSPLHDDKDQNVLSVEIRDDSIQDGNIQIQKSEENVTDTHTDKSLEFDNKNEQTQHIALEDETMTEGENIEMCLTSKLDKTANTDNSECEVTEEAEVMDTSENLNDTSDMEYSKLSDMSTDKISTPLKILTNKTTTNELQEIEGAATVSSHENIMKKSSDIHAQSNNIKLANENESNITDVTENSQSLNVAQASAEPIDKALVEVDVTQSTSKEDNCMVSEGKSKIVSNLQNDVEKNEILETVQKQEEKMQVDDNRSDANIATDLFQDIPADEWKDTNYDKNSVHSMSTEKLENESENECDDFVLVDKEVSQTAENISIENEKERIDYDSDDTVLLKAQKDAAKEKTVARLEISESQSEKNENKSAVEKDSQQFMQQEEIKEAESVIKDAEFKSENQKESVTNQTEEIQNGENVSMRTSITNEVSKQSPQESDTSIEDPVDENLTNDIDQNLNILSTESSLTKRKSKNKLSEDVSNERKSPCKSVEKSEGEVEDSSETDMVEQKNSLNKSPIGSPSNISDISKTDESMDSDIEREYNLLGVEESKFSDDDVPGDECRASETESSDPDDNGSDLADFVVNDDDEISEEVESSEIDEVSYSGQDDRHGESDQDAIERNEQRGKMQMQEESDEKARKKGKQKRIDMGTSKKEKCKFHNSVKLGLDKITESDKKIKKSEIRTIVKKRKRNKIDDSDDDISGGNVKRLEKGKKLNKKKIVERQESDEEEVHKQYRKVQMSEDIIRNITKKRQQKRAVEENVPVIQNKCVDTIKKERSKLRKTTKLDLSEMLESGKNIKRKCEIETGNKIRKIRTGDNDYKTQKENAIPSWNKYENPTVKSIEIKVSKKRARHLLEEGTESHSDVTLNKSKKRKLFKPEELMLTSRSILDSVLSNYGSTSNFYVTNIQKLKRRRNNVEVQLYRRRMLNRKARLSNYKFSAKPF